MNQKGRQHKRWYLPAAALACLLAAVNASQGMVLCFGAHGHVAIEPADHLHCDGTVHCHEHGADVEPFHEHATGYAARERCNPCVDIPLSLGPLNGRTLSSLPEDAVTLAIGEPSALFRNLAPPCAVSEGVLLPAQQAALRSVMLQV
jgi:hypothetical protein